MEKRLLFAVLLSALVLLAYYATLDVPQKEQPETKQEESFSGAPSVPEAPSQVSPLLTSSPVPSSAGGRDVVVETERYRLILTTGGARLKSLRLKEYSEIWKEEAELKKELDSIDRQLSGHRDAVSKIEAESRGGNGDARSYSLGSEETDPRQKLESLIRARESLLYIAKETGERRRRIAELEEEIEEARSGGDSRRMKQLENELSAERGVELIPPAGPVHGDYPLTLIFPGLDVAINNILYGCAVDSVDLTGGQEKATVEFEADVGEGLKLKKKFTFSPGGYVIGLDVVLENSSSGSFGDERAMLVYGPGVGLLERAQVRGATKKVASYIRGRPKAKFESLEGRRAGIAPGAAVTRTGDFQWVALRNKYFAAILIPRGECPAIRIENFAGGGQSVGVKIPSFDLEAGKAFTANFEIYLGPQGVEELKEAGRSLEKIIDYGFWEPIAKALDFMLRVFFRAVGNYGWSIVLLSLFIKIIFYPLTHRSFEGMSKMQTDMKSLQPKIDELKKKHGGNQQKLNKATMELYRREGINPLSGCKSGCFPMLLQMPVFFALYVVLYNCIDLRGAHFAGWISDLSAPDPWRVLPILMGASMFWQQKLTGMGGGMGGAAMGGSSSSQQDQQKMMKWMMPAFLTFIFFRLPAGVVLYWFSFNIFTSLQQLLIKKKKSAGEEVKP